MIITAIPKKTGRNDIREKYIFKIEYFRINQLNFRISTSRRAALDKVPNFNKRNRAIKSSKNYEKIDEKKRVTVSSRKNGSCVISWKTETGCEYYLYSKK